MVTAFFEEIKLAKELKLRSNSPLYANFEMFHGPNFGPLESRGCLGSRVLRGHLILKKLKI